MVIDSFLFVEDDPSAKERILRLPIDFAQGQLALWPCDRGGPHYLLHTFPLHLIPNLVAGEPILQLSGMGTECSHVWKHNQVQGCSTHGGLGAPLPLNILLLSLRGALMEGSFCRESMKKAYWVVRKEKKTRRANAAAIRP